MIAWKETNNSGTCRSNPGRNVLLLRAAVRKWTSLFVGGIDETFGVRVPENIPACSKVNSANLVHRGPPRKPTPWVFVPLMQDVNVRLHIGVYFVNHHAS